MIEALILQLCLTLKHFDESWEPVLRPEMPRDRKAPHSEPFGGK